MRPLVREETYCFLSEEVSTPEDQHWKSDGSSYTVTAQNIGGTNESILYVTYPGCMQTFGDTNYNHRDYDGPNVYGAFMQDVHAQKKYRMNKLTGELGHPAATFEGQEMTFNRLCEVPKERSVMILHDLRLDGNRMLAQVQTDPGTQDFGVNIAKSIIGAGYIPSHSLRSFGIIRPGTAHHDSKGIVEVKKFITYDMVESPSHVNADALFRPNKDTMKGAYQKTFENAEMDENGTLMIPYQDLAYYAMQESKTSYLMEAFQLEDQDLFGVTPSGNSVVLRQNSDIFFVPTNESVSREIGEVLKKHMKNYF